MKKQLQLVTYEQAKKLKELGFDWECTHCYTFAKSEKKGVNNMYSKNFNSTENCVSVPTVALALKWLRDVKHDHSSIICDLNGQWTYYVQGTELDEDFKAFSDCELAESALLDELLITEYQIQNTEY
jgi:hypothetical protein